MNQLWADAPRAGFYLVGFCVVERGAWSTHRGGSIPRVCSTGTLGVTVDLCVVRPVLSISVEEGGLVQHVSTKAIFSVGMLSDRVL